MSRMGQHRIGKLSAIAAFGIAAALTASSMAQAQSGPQRVRVRGTLTAITDSTVSVKSREGKDETIALKAGWTLTGVTKASMSDIKVGDYLGITSVPKSDGGNGAVEVLIFPVDMKGTGEGSFPFDLLPNSTMTNATVSQTIKAVDGQDLTMTYQGKEKKITVPPGTPIVTFAPATKADLTAGAGVIVTAEKATDGSLSASRVAVGLHGLTPPM